MLFNSFPFLVFFPVTLLVYFILPKFKMVRTLWLLAASYFFYMSWNPVYGLLLLFCTLVTYLGAIMIQHIRDKQTLRRIIVKQLADDDKCAAERQSKCEDVERLKAERDEWRPIHAYFGDNDGKKIRREIQSYVLANVLVKANHYLKQLSNRYELSCEGLTLSVKDAFAGGAVRPVNTLSGGEQFLVSLALALGLAGMSDTGLGVDMLLIDEGFGTLSGEHLNSAIEALERLNALTGSRKVGVISHVERLRERIRTHIEVVRNGQSPSEVRVVANAARMP